MRSTRPKPLFIVGNERSGSSLFVNLLNMHDDVFVTHECDIVWMLFQLYSGRNGGIVPYAHDDRSGLLRTLETCRPLLNARSVPAGDLTAVVNVFYSTTKQIQENGRGNWDKPKKGHCVRWTGDKKPVQHCDPEVQEFMRAAFPYATYFHVIRHPRSVVASKMRAAANWDDESLPDYWRGTASEILERWATHEEWVLDMKNTSSDGVHTFRLEDIAISPEETLDEIFGVLDLETPDRIRRFLRKWVRKRPNKNYQSFELPPSEKVDRIMEVYGYSRN